MYIWAITGTLVLIVASSGRGFVRFPLCYGDLMRFEFTALLLLWKQLTILLPKFLFYCLFLHYKTGNTRRVIIIMSLSDSINIVFKKFNVLFWTKIQILSQMLLNYYNNRMRYYLHINLENNKLADKEIFYTIKNLISWKKERAIVLIS